MCFQPSWSAIAFSLFLAIPSICAAENHQPNEVVRFSNCSAEQIALLEKETIFDISGLTALDAKWIFLNERMFRARRQILGGSPFECGPYPNASSVGSLPGSFFLRMKDMCSGDYCYTFIFDGFGVERNLTKQPFQHFGLTRGDFSRESKKSDIESILSRGAAFPFGVTYWVDFAASGRIKFMLPPIYGR